MKYVVAVSGGVDSVVLLDMLVRQGCDIVVAHFDHGIRPDSAGDERFVRGLADYYGVPYESRREELGRNTSEAHARERRYGFLREVARRHDGTVATAHHRDDLIETIVINLTRGTGWRGLTVLAAADIARPLLTTSKSDIYAYAMKYRLEWVEDETNATDAYLRNRIRKKLHTLDESAKLALVDLRNKQLELRTLIDTERERLLKHAAESRYFFNMIPDDVAVEMLAGVLAMHGMDATRPSRRRLLHDIKVRMPGSVSRVIPGAEVRFGAKEFVVKPLK